MLRAKWAHSLPHTHTPKHKHASITVATRGGRPCMDQCPTQRLTATSNKPDRGIENNCFPLLQRFVRGYCLHTVYVAMHSVCHLVEKSRASLFSTLHMSVLLLSTITSYYLPTEGATVSVSVSIPNSKIYKCFIFCCCNIFFLTIICMGEACGPPRVREFVHLRCYMAARTKKWPFSHEHLQRQEISAEELQIKAGRVTWTNSNVGPHLPWMCTNASVCQDFTNNNDFSGHHMSNGRWCSACFDVLPPWGQKGLMQL